MKLLKIFALLFVFVSFFSCNLQKEKDLASEIELLKNQNDGYGELIDSEEYDADVAKYRNLGYGYDFLHSNGDTPLGAKGRVIDLKRLMSGNGVDPVTGEAKQFEPLGIEIAAINGQKQREVYGSNFTEFQKNLNLSAGLKFSYPGISWLSVQISAEYDKKLTSKAKHSFHQLKVNQILKRIYFEMISLDRLKFFLTDEFRSSLNTATAEEFIASYGTHVLTDIIIGGQLTMYTTAEVANTDKSSFYQFSADLFDGIVKSSAKNSKVDKNETKNISVKLFSTGGNVTSTTRNIIDMEGNIDPNAFDFEKWIEGVDDNSSVLIGMTGDAKAISILDFVFDQNKKDQLLAEIRRKSDENAIIPGNPIPVDMFVVWETGKHIEKNQAVLTPKTVKESYLVFRPAIFDPNFEIDNLDVRAVLMAKVQSKNKDGVGVGDFVAIEDEVRGFSMERFEKHPRAILSNNGQPVLASANLKNLTAYQKTEKGKYGFLIKDMVLTLYLGEESVSYAVSSDLAGKILYYDYNHNDGKTTNLRFSKKKATGGSVQLY